MSATLLFRLSRLKKFGTRHDRTEKLALYARAGIPEYWLLDVHRKTLAVHRNPADGAYRTRTVHRAGDSVAPLARPESALPVADLLG